MIPDKSFRYGGFWADVCPHHFQQEFIDYLFETHDQHARVDNSKKEKELTRQYHLAKLRRNKVEMRRIEDQLRYVT